MYQKLKNLIMKILAWFCTPQSAVAVGIIVVSISRISSGVIPESLLPITDICSSLGLALFSVGVVSFALDMPRLREYFALRLREIVIGHSYLSGLSDEGLKTLLVKLCKSLTKHDHLDEKDSFYNYYSVSLLEYISTPYRENMSKIIKFEAIKEEDTKAEVTATLFYVCRKGAHGIQERVIFGFEEGQVENCTSYLAECSLPENCDHREKCDNHDENNGAPYYCRLNKAICPYKIINTKPSPEDDSKQWLILTQDNCNTTPNCKSIFDIGLRGGKNDGCKNRDQAIRDIDLTQCDKLRIRIIIRYQKRIDSFETTRMSHLTRGFLFHVIPPCGYDVHFQSLFRDGQQDISLPFNYPDWVLPLLGVVYSLKKKV